MTGFFSVERQKGLYSFYIEDIFYMEILTIKCVRKGQ